MFIYMTINKINNKKYIGMCTRETDVDYFGSGKIIKDAIKKYGKKNFERVILEETDCLEKLSELEKHYIDYYDAVNSEEFYNIAHGGRGGNPITVKNYWDCLTIEQREKRLHNFLTRKRTGNKNSMYGRSAIKENNYRWYNNSVRESMYIEGTQPDGYFEGRLFVPTYDKSGSNNPKSKKVVVNGVMYECIKDVLKDYPHIPYSSLKGAAKKGKLKKYKLEITYV